MQIKNWHLVLVTVLLIFVIILLFLFDEPNVIIGGIASGYNAGLAVYSRSDCDMRSNETYRKFMDKYNIGFSSKQWDIYIPCSYDFIDTEINRAPASAKGVYFLIDNIDQMTAKNMLWKNMLDMYGYEKTVTFSPNTYLLYSDADISRLKSSHRAGKKYIMKKNIQRQLGLKLTDSLQEIISARKEYVIAQDLLLNPYLIDGRKINLRVYVCVMTCGNRITAAMYPDGFMYYTKDLFNPNSMSDGAHITTGYVDRWIYDKYPLTHKDFIKYLDDPNRIVPDNGIEYMLRERNVSISQIVFKRIQTLLQNVFRSFKGKINRKENKLYNNTCYELMGTDIAIDNLLNPTIMEINKGPDLSPKDNRDGTLKLELLSDIHKFIGSIPGCHSFITLFDEKN